MASEGAMRPLKATLVLFLVLTYLTLFEMLSRTGQLQVTSAQEITGSHFLSSEGFLVCLPASTLAPRLLHPLETLRVLVHTRACHGILAPELHPLR